MSDVCRVFVLNFFLKNPRDVPQLKAFQRLVRHFKTSGATRPLTPRGRHRGREMSRRLLVRGTRDRWHVPGDVEDGDVTVLRAQAARRGYWFQQDGVPVHVTIEVMDFLRSKFGGRSCSPGEPSTIGQWPPYSQDLPCLDFSFWPQASPEVAERIPETLDE